jgi:hypothetical protein
MFPTSIHADITPAIKILAYAGLLWRGYSVSDPHKDDLPTMGKLMKLLQHLYPQLSGYKNESNYFIRWHMFEPQSDPPLPGDSLGFFARQHGGLELKNKITVYGYKFLDSE